MRKSRYAASSNEASVILPSTGARAKMKGRLSSAVSRVVGAQGVLLPTCYTAYKFVAQ